MTARLRSAPPRPGSGSTERNLSLLEVKAVNQGRQPAWPWDHGNGVPDMRASARLDRRTGSHWRLLRGPGGPGPEGRYERSCDLQQGVSGRYRLAGNSGGSYGRRPMRSARERRCPMPLTSFVATVPPSTERTCSTGQVAISGSAGTPFRGVVILPGVEPSAQESSPCSACAWGRASSGPVGVARAHGGSPASRTATGGGRGWRWSWSGRGPSRAAPAPRTWPPA